MNSKLPISTSFLLLLALTSCAIDPVLDYKNNTEIQPNDKILKWEKDINGDGHNEILLALKSDYDDARKNHDIPAWEVYFANEDGSDFSVSKGIQDQHDEPNSVGVGGLPDIDTELCYIGQITEIGKHGIITMKIRNPREGESIGEIFAYTIEGDHLKQIELAQYIIIEGPHPLFTKYLEDDKKTTIAVTELDP